MHKNSLFKFSFLFIIGCILFGTNPNYEKHELIVSENCQENQSEKNISMCPLGYGNKEKSKFKREEFSVYNVGILSYSVYKKDLATIGIFGNVFLNSKIKEV